MARTTQRVAKASRRYGPLRFANSAMACAHLRVPAGANCVVWNDAWPNDMEYVMANYLAADDILVLPERAEPYYINSANGFTYPSSVKSWSDGALLVTNNRTWGEMTRVRRGILGLGPGAVVALKPSSFTQVAQGDEKTRYYTNSSGTNVYENGTFEKIIGCAHKQPYFGNFTLAPSLDFGGVAYNAIVWTPDVTTGAKALFERISARGAHRGFAAVPNGETGTIALTRGAYEIYDCEIDCRLPDGTAVGTSPIMINSSSSGLMQHCYFHHAALGMPTLWNCSGTHTMNHVRSEDQVTGPAWNLEKNQSGVTFNFNHCTMTLGMKKFQLNIGSYDSSAIINCRDVKFIPSQGYWPGYFSIQTYSSSTSGPYNQNLSDITIRDADGNKVPTKIVVNSVVSNL